MQDGGWFRKIISIDGIPVGLIIFLAVAIVCAILLNKTKLGRYILCLGSNKEAVRLSGVNVKKWEMSAYIICGILVGISAIFYTAAYTTVQPGYGDQYNNEAIAGCVMGGTSMAGGLASISGTVIGCIHHRIASGRYSCSWLYKRLSAYHHRSYRYRRSIQ